MASHAVCRTDELAVGEKKLVEAGGESILIFHVPEGFFATQAKCPHILAPLKKGKMVDACIVQCPFHRARFDVRTGACIEWANWPPGLVNVLNAFRGEKNLKTYKVTVDNEQVSVEL
jgi:3-phenylpropionate/trans-cinnamate dioxygenase ferredoxin subunit